MRGKQIMLLRLLKTIKGLFKDLTTRPKKKESKMEKENKLSGTNVKYFVARSWANINKQSAPKAKRPFYYLCQMHK